MAIYTFGSGTLWGVRTDIANATPVRFGALQEVSLEFSATNKTLYGQYQFPLAVARGTGKITGKAKFGQISGSLYAGLFFGITPATGQSTTSNNEAATVPSQASLTTSATTSAGSAVLTFTSTTGVSVGQTVSGTNIPTGASVLSFTSTTVTISGNVQTGGVASGATITFGPTFAPANSATFVGDLGVIYSATGLPLTKVASAPSQGQYAVNSSTGSYTFAAADAGTAVLVSYTYGIAATGQKIVVPNQLLGVQPVFQTTLETLYNGQNGLKKAVLTLNACVSSKLSAPTKQDDFSIPEMDFDAFADAAGNLFSWSFSEAS